MSHSGTKLGIILSLFCLVVTAFGTFDDNELWISVEIEKDLAKRLSTSLEQEFRRDENYSEYKNNLTSLSFTYKLHSHVKMTTNYRFARYTDEVRQRLGLGVVLRSGKSWRFDNRLRYQVDFREDQESIGLFRNRLRLTYTGLKKVKPYLSLEGFLQAVDDKPNWVEYRFSSGISYKITKQMTAKFFCHLKIEDLTDEKPDYISVLGFKLGYTL